MDDLQYNVCMIQFEWDRSKATANLKKHGISFEEAQSVFYDEMAIQFYDLDHSSSEDRFIMLGMSSSARVLVVCHCEHKSGDLIRIISARKASSRECAFYGGDLA